MKKSIPLICFVTISLLCTCQLVFAEKRLPLRVQMVLIKIEPLFEKGLYDQAVTILSTFQNKKKGPEDTIHDHAEINFTRGNCHMLIGELNKAKSHYLKTVSRDPEHLGGWQNLAKTEYELENYTAASNAFFTSYELTNKTDPALLYYSAVTLLMAQQYEKCLHYFDSLLTAHPEKVTLQWKENLVYALMHCNKPQRAIPYMIELAERFSGKKQRHWQEILLQQYIALEMRKKAKALVNTLTRKDPTVAIWWKALAHIQLQEDHFTKALSAMTIYSFLSPLTREEEKLLGDLYMQQGIPEKAVVNYEHCVTKGIDPQTLLSLIRSYLDLGRPHLALEKLNTMGEAIEAQKRSMLQGEIHYLMKDYQQAAKLYEKAAKCQGKESARAFLMAGYSYWQHGNTKKAQQNFHEAGKKKQFKNEADKALTQLARLTT